MAEMLDLTKLTPAQLAQLQRILSAGLPAAAEGPDFSRVRSVLVCHNRTNPHAFYASEIEKMDAIDASGNAGRDANSRGKCPECGAALGAAPIAINDIVIAQGDHAALRAGDSATHAKYAPVVEVVEDAGNETTTDTTKPEELVTSITPLAGGNV